MRPLKGSEEGGRERDRARAMSLGFIWGLALCLKRLNTPSHLFGKRNARSQFSACPLRKYFLCL